MFESVSEVCWDFLGKLERCGDIGDDLRSFEYTFSNDIFLEVSSPFTEHTEGSLRTKWLVEFGYEDPDTHKLTWGIHDRSELPPHLWAYRRIRITADARVELARRRNRERVITPNAVPTSLLTIPQLDSSAKPSTATDSSKKAVQPAKRGRPKVHDPNKDASWAAAWKSGEHESKEKCAAALGTTVKELDNALTRDRGRRAKNRAQ